MCLLLLWGIGCILRIALVGSSGSVVLRLLECLVLRGGETGRWVKRSGLGCEDGELSVVASVVWLVDRAMIHRRAVTQIVH